MSSVSRPPRRSEGSHERRVRGSQGSRPSGGRGAAEGHHRASTRRRPILLLAEDTSPGRHDTIIAACDDYRYGLLGCKDYHDNCTDNLLAGMRQIGLNPPEVPAPLNLWMHI